MSRNLSELRPASVRCYSGYRGEEKPVSFSLDGGTFRIHRIMDRRRVHSTSGVRTEEYRVTVMNGREFHLVFDPGKTVWTARAIK